MKNKNNKKENNEINNSHHHKDTCNDCVIDKHYSYQSLVDDLYGKCHNMMFEEDSLWYDDVISALDRVKTYLTQEQSEFHMESQMDKKLKEYKKQRKDELIVKELQTKAVA